MKRGTESSAPVHSAFHNQMEQVAEHNDGARRGNEGGLRGLIAGIGSEWIVASVSFVLLAIALLMDAWIRPYWFTGSIRLSWYAITYIPVGLPVVIRGIKLALRGELFTEFFLMSIATLGAFYVGQYPEGVAVMLFYAVGELFQGAAVRRARRSIKALLDVRPEVASVFRDGKYVSVHPAQVRIDETIQIKAGDRVPLDGRMLSEESSFNTAALTGESRPTWIGKNEIVLAGMINESKVVELQVTRDFNNSALSRILALVQNAQGRKAKTELFIRRFARVYTPIVVFLAIGLTTIPYFFVGDYDFDQWLYRALIFLVISCPCALVVAIPLGYFGGIGAGSRNGILFKGSSYLDRITRVDTVVMDKTGTLTKGIFKVRQVVSSGMPESEWLPLVAAIEAQSTHPVASAVVAYAGSVGSHAVENLKEIKGYGLSGVVGGRAVLAGNAMLMEKFRVKIDPAVHTLTDTVVAVAVDGTMAGFIVIADEIKEDAVSAVARLHALHIKTIMLSGDRQSVVDQVAQELHMDQAYGDLLPEDKVQKLEEIKKGGEKVVAFVGDGLNDAPVLAISDVGIAMGGLGSDVAIETADVVIQTDQPSKIVTAIRIGQATNRIVWQNIALAFGIKLVVMIFAAWGMASMWEAVFADVGVALLAILNAVRIQRMSF